MWRYLPVCGNASASIKCTTVVFRWQGVETLQSSELILKLIPSENGNSEFTRAQKVTLHIVSPPQATRASSARCITAHSTQSVRMAEVACRDSQMNAATHPVHQTPVQLTGCVQLCTRQLTIGERPCRIMLGQTTEVLQSQEWQ